jgi:hypothetical protein
MAITLGNTSITGLGVGGLPANSVNSTSLADSAVTAAKLAITGGTVIQVVTTVYTSTWSVGGSADTWYDTPVSLSITPNFSSSYIMIQCNIGTSWCQNGKLFRVLRNNGNLYSQNQGDGAGSRATGNWWQSLPSVGDTNHGSSSTMMMYDNPATTSATTYKIQVYGEGGTHYLNYHATNADGGVAYGARHATNITLLEIKY